MRKQNTKKCPKCNSDMNLHISSDSPRVLDWEIGGGTAQLPVYEPLPSACAAGADEDYPKVYWKCTKCEHQE